MSNHQSRGLGSVLTTLFVCALGDVLIYTIATGARDMFKKVNDKLNVPAVSK